MGRPVQVVILAILDGPGEQEHAQGHQKQHQGDQEHDIMHDNLLAWGLRQVFQAFRLRRRALSTTMSELADMPIAASQGATSPAAARGSAQTLYPKAQIIVWRIIRRVCRLVLRVSTGWQSCPFSRAAAALSGVRSAGLRMATEIPAPAM